MQRGNFRVVTCEKLTLSALRTLYAPRVLTSRHRLGAACNADAGGAGSTPQSRPSPRAAALIGVTCPATSSDRAAAIARSRSWAACW